MTKYPRIDILGSPDLDRLYSAFGTNLKTGESLARYTSARVGGPADALLIVHSAEEISVAVRWLWGTEIPFFILGAGSNILVSDKGVRGVVILNQSRSIQFLDSDGDKPPRVWAESGANFGAISRQAAWRGLSGLEWAVGIPGTVGGAVVGNAGAHGSEMAENLVMAGILHPENKEEIEQWKAEKFEFAYRSSIMKKFYLSQRPQPGCVILDVVLKLQYSEKEIVQARIDEFVEHRHRTQPPGASMGSMFKNPPGDFAGRLIDVAGLKGVSVGQAEISSLHGNFFINRGGASATDIRHLITLARTEVQEKFGVSLELEIELVGDWA